MHRCPSVAGVISRSATLFSLNFCACTSGPSDAHFRVTANDLAGKISGAGNAKINAFRSCLVMIAETICSAGAASTAFIQTNHQPNAFRHPPAERRRWAIYRGHSAGLRSVRSFAPCPVLPLPGTRFRVVTDYVRSLPGSKHQRNTPVSRRASSLAERDEAVARTRLLT